MSGCAETVEDETSLWKGKEKREEIPGHGFIRRNADNFFVVSSGGFAASSFFYIAEK
jgi:hypothetical protein